MPPTAKAETGPRLGRPRATHCHRGHPFTEENTQVGPDGRRNCRTCRRHRQHRYWTRKYRDPEFRERFLAYQRRRYERYMQSPEGRWKRRKGWITQSLKRRQRKQGERDGTLQNQG